MTKLKSCQNCKNEFKPKDKTKKFCCVECYREHQRAGNYKTGSRLPVRPCFTCGKGVQKIPSQKRNGEKSDKVFCCRACYLEYHKPQILSVNCSGCGTSIEVNKTKLNESGQHYCTTACRRKIRVSTCKACNVEFSAIAWRSKAAGYARVIRSTCSDECLREFYRTDKGRKEKISAAFRGENHPQ